MSRAERRAEPEPEAGAQQLEPMDANARALELELEWFARVLDARFKRYFDPQSDAPEVLELSPPDFSALGEEVARRSSYVEFARHYRLALSERVLLMLTLAPHLRPELLDVFGTRNKTFDHRFTEFGGARKPGGEFIPTGETLAFILGGRELDIRFRVRGLLDPEHVLLRHGVIKVDAPAGERLGPLKAPVRITEEFLDILTLGRRTPPRFGPGFPARRVETRLDWEDLVLHPGTRAQVEELLAWIEHGGALLERWGMARSLRPGYRCLFYGPPGTGKTITATLLGKTTGRPVYKVDLSRVVSKYIGETEKNLARVFDQAERRDWILFFDEADALFGRRAETKDAHDRYANQEVAFLLQRIESFDGLAILASNLRDNLDAAFARRFESLIYFPMPRPEERLELWRRGFSPRARFADDVNLERLAREHTLAGGGISNVIRFVSLRSIRDGERPITRYDLQMGVRRELNKEGKAG